ncbi:hypothetical protein HJC23_013824 [Cyclotella cryptica]|uniref:Uncharacterized protein n=1 Tax=Cyclotella cryptica TaxID=29204 RepID=A0ABD3PAT7_9STRA
MRKKSHKPPPPPSEIIAYTASSSQPPHDTSELDVAPSSLELPPYPNAHVEQGQQQQHEHHEHQQRRSRRNRDRDDFRTSITPNLLTTDLLVDSDDGSFWNLAPRWIEDVYRRTARSVADSSTLLFGVEDDREVVCARDEWMEEMEDLPPGHGAADGAALDDNGILDELSSFGGTETGRLSKLTERSVKSAVVRVVVLLALVGTGIALIVRLATTTSTSSHYDRVRFKWSSLMDHVRDSRVFQKRRSRRYLPMKTRLMLISGAEVFEDDTSPQHRALLFLSDGDPLALERLNLEGNRLTGSLPNIFDSVTLQDVRLGDNLLTSTILPSLMGGAGTRPSPIIKCDLHGNLLTGKLPVVTNAPELKFLYLNVNELSGTIPGDIFCPGSNSADIRLNNNLLSGEIPNISCTMVELQLFNLASNALRGSILPFLGNLMPRVREIHLFGNKLTSTIPESLFQPPNLTAVLLGNIGLKGSLTATMFSNTNRRELFYANANMLSGNLAGISTAKHLVKLRLEKNMLTGTIPPTYFPKLELFYSYNDTTTAI